MDKRIIDKLGRRLKSTAPLLGKKIRRTACRKLAEDRSKAAVPLLIDALASEDEEVVSMADAALRQVKDMGVIDKLCALWAKKREDHIGDIIAECGYEASKPSGLMVLTKLKTGKRVRLTENSVKLLPVLLKLLADSDPDVRKNVEDSLHLQKDPAVIDALCEAVIANPSGPAAEIVKAEDYRPQSVSRRCLLLLLTGQLDAYFDLDFDFQHLRAEYGAAGEALRQRISETIRRSGDARLLGLFRETRRQKSARDLTVSEARVIVDVHARNEQWDDILSLLFHIPLAAAVEALDVLSGANWTPQDDTRAALLAELTEARRKVGKLPEAPKSPEVALGRVMAGWIKRGRTGDAAGLSEDELRARIDGGAPVEAVEALAALTAKGAAGPDDIENARTHKLWPVRLACLALCELEPQFLTADKPTSGDGGGYWIEKLAPPILHEATYGRRALSLTPDRLDALQQGLKRSKTSDAARLGCLRMLEILGRHHLRHTIDVDEEMKVQVSETAIEIDG